MLQLTISMADDFTVNRALCEAAMSNLREARSWATEATIPDQDRRNVYRVCRDNAKMYLRRLPQEDGERILRFHVSYLRMSMKG
jgi:hypothetical protein